VDVQPTTKLQKIDPEFEPVLTFASVPMDTPPVIDIFVARSLSSLRWTVTSLDEIIWADIKNPEYEIRYHSPSGELKKTITRIYDPISITTEDKKRLMEETFGDNPTDQWDIRFPDNYPAFSGFSSDDLGHLFVKRYERVKDERGGLYDIFDGDIYFMFACNGWFPKYTSCGSRVLIDRDILGTNEFTFG